MKLSARNQLKGTIKAIEEGAVNGVVVICLGNNKIKADITMESIKALDLEVGKQAYGIVKASSVMVATTKLENISARNQLAGKIVDVVEGAVNGHVTIEVDEGVKITSSITNEAINQLGISVGDDAVAIVKATDVMVGID